jgi:hypothetical protein
MWTVSRLQLLDGEKVSLGPGIQNVDDLPPNLVIGGIL